ncbi:hypothetical protein [Actinoplanes sp. NPDC051851]|uniref:hypothetical protein n=1 Tax=Actinoplanes sp. NPDC051851 TaxID=3154753 RepID=UPI0034465B75
MNDLILVDLDESGRLRDLKLHPWVAHLELDELRTALIAAFAGAQDRARARLDDAIAGYGAGADARELTEGLAAVTSDAERRFAEISVALYDLSRRAARPW